MTIDHIIKALNCCRRIYNFSCADCPLYKVEESDRTCQDVLYESIVEKLTRMRDLIDDRVNHHYYETLEFYQEENDRLRNNLDRIKEFVNQHID